MLQGLAARIIVGVIAAIGSLRVGTGLYAWKVTEGLERPSYKVVEKLSDGVEIRYYEPYLIAETIVDGTGFREPTAEGFRACAGYIFGKNKKKKKLSSWFTSTTTTTDSNSNSKSQESSSSSVDETCEKMAMTAPVRIAGGSQKMKKTKVSFVIGTKYSLKTAPVPLNKNVKLRQVSSHTLAVRTFSGPPPKDQRVEKERQRIEQALIKAGKSIPSPSKETLVYGYHDPFFTPNLLRRNEVAVVIEGYA